MIVAARRETIAADLVRPVLVRIDGASGRELSSAPLGALADKDPQLGPLVPVGDRWWTFAGKGQREPTRDVVELVPVSDLLAGDSAPLPELTGWKGVPIDQRLQQGLGAALPGWFCVQGFWDGRSGWRDSHRGRRELAAIVAHKHRPAVLVGGWPLDPQGGRPIRLHVGLEGDEKWLLRVKVAGHVVAEERVEPETTSDGWREIAVSPPSPVLANFARPGSPDRIVAIVLEAVPTEKDQALTLWGR